MLVKAIETFKKLSGEVVRPGDVLDLPSEKASGLIERGRVRPIIEDQKHEDSLNPEGQECEGYLNPKVEDPTSFDVSQVSSKTETTIATWDSPVFGRLEAPILSRDCNTFTLIHPLTRETVTLSNEWLVSMDERSAILEFDGGLPREEADDQAKREFFGLFRNGGAK